MTDREVRRRDSGGIYRVIVPTTPLHAQYEYYLPVLHLLDILTRRDTIKPSEYAEPGLGIGG